MKKLSIVIATIALLAMLVPAASVFAETTTVTVASGSGGIPVTKLKWEQEPDNSIFLQGATTGSGGAMNLESGDPTHLTPGSQFNPPLAKCAVRQIDYYAVVTDAEEMGNVYEVFAYVYHPEDSPAPYNAALDPEGRFARFKYKVVFTRITDQVEAAALINAADAAHLITYQSPYTLAEVTGPNGEITKGTANLWKGTAMIDYEQPAGDYAVRVWSVDHNNNRSLPTDGLLNFFRYVPIAGIQVDFTGIDYGSVNLGQIKMVPGDWNWTSPAAIAGPPENPSSPRATVRNIGNTWAHVTVRESDMTFGFAGAGPGTSLVSSSPLGAASNWNVNFDLRMGSNDTYRIYFDPNKTVTTPNFLGLSTIEELDFSILVKNGFGSHNGTLTIGQSIEPFGAGGAGNSFGPVGQPNPCPVANP